MNRQLTKSRHSQSSMASSVSGYTLNTATAPTHTTRSSLHSSMRIVSSCLYYDILYPQPPTPPSFKTPQGPLLTKYSGHGSCILHISSSGLLTQKPTAVPGVQPPSFLSSLHTIPSNTLPVQPPAFVIHSTQHPSAVSAIPMSYAVYASRPRL